MGIKVDQGGCRVGLYIQPASKGIYAIVAQKKINPFNFGPKR